LFALRIKTTLSNRPVIFFPEYLSRTLNRRAIRAVQDPASDLEGGVSFSSAHDFFWLTRFLFFIFRSADTSLRTVSGPVSCDSFCCQAFAPICCTIHTSGFWFGPPDTFHWTPRPSPTFPSLPSISPNLCGRLITMNLSMASPQRQFSRFVKVTEPAPLRLWRSFFCFPLSFSMLFSSVHFSRIFG